MLVSDFSLTVKVQRTSTSRMVSQQWVVYVIYITPPLHKAQRLMRMMSRKECKSEMSRTGMKLCLWGMLH